MAALALVRAVGHVLDKVDGKDAAIHALASAAHRRWKSDDPAHEIFREFIELERNSILKEYEFNIHPEKEIHIAVTQTLRRVSDGALVDASGVYPIGDNIYRPMMSGFRELDDARDVLTDAIEWWEAELTNIERSLSANAG